MRVDSPDGVHHAELSRTEESAGCHGVGGYHAVPTVVRVRDRAGHDVLVVERTLSHVISDNRPDEIRGTTIEACASPRTDGRSS